MYAAGSGLKVCHVFAGTEGGRWVCEQLKALKDEHGCEVHAVLGGASGSTVDLCRQAGIRVKPFDFRWLGWTSLFSIPWRIVQLAWWMRGQRFDVVQSHVIQSTLFARPAAWLADVPVRIVMVTGPFYMQAQASRRMEKSTVFMETGIVPSCNLTAQLYRDAGVPERMILPTLYYGPRAEQWEPDRTSPAGLRAELGFAPGTPLIGCVAIFYPRCGAGAFVPPETHNKHVKGHAELIQAMPTVLRAHPDAKLLLIGGGWGAAGELAEAELREIVAENGVEASVIFTGYRNDIAAIYMDLDVSVQASLNENLGGTVESLLMRSPTVATRVGGMVDSVVDGETGVLVEPGDPQDLARGIIRLLDDREEARRLGRAGRERMLAGFTLETTARELARLYRRERNAASGAWRLHRGAARMAIAALLHGPVLGRAIAWDIYAANVVPHIYHGLVGRAWIVATALRGLVTGKSAA